MQNMTPGMMSGGGFGFGDGSGNYGFGQNVLQIPPSAGQSTFANTAYDATTHGAIIAQNTAPPASSGGTAVPAVNDPTGVRHTVQALVRRVGRDGEAINALGQRVERLEERRSP